MSSYDSDKMGMIHPLAVIRLSELQPARARTSSAEAIIPSRKLGHNIAFP